MGMSFSILENQKLRVLYVVFSSVTKVLCFICFRRLILVNLQYLYFCFAVLFNLCNFVSETIIRI